MSKKLLVLIICVLGIMEAAIGQNDGKIVIKGTVVDETTNEPIAFANLVILNSILGIASDMDGKFELVLPYEAALHNMRISAVGYKSVEMSVYEGKNRPDLQIKLQPISYSIREVDVYGELLVYKKMLRNVVDRIRDNYIDQPYNYEGYFKQVIEINGVEKTKEAVVTIYDAKGYHRENPEVAFKEIAYTYNQVRRTQKPESVLDGLTALDDILSSDIVRNTRNVLDIVNSRDYKLKSKGEILYEGDSVQVISYSVKNPTISTTGDAAIKTYNGEIFVNLKDFAVLKNVIYITSADYNALGRNLVTIDEKPKNDVKMTITTNYKKLNEIYFLSGVNIEYSYQEESNNIKGKMEFVTTKVNIDSPKILEGRVYYEDIEENEEFWNQYSVYFQE